MNYEDDFDTELLGDQPIIKKQQALKPLSLKELMEVQYGDTEWIVEQLVPVGGIIAVSGTPSAYKTWLVLDIALKVAQGSILFDRFATKKTGVLIIDEETGDRWLQQRVKKMQKDYSLPVYLLSKSGFTLYKQSVEAIIAITEEHEIGFVIFDSFVRVSNARDENSATEIAKVFRYMQTLTNAGLTVLFTHHNRKPGILRSSNISQDMRGSSDILAAVDCHIAIDRGDDFVTVTQTKLRQAEEHAPFKLAVISDDNEFRFEYAGEIDEVKSRMVSFQQAITDLLNQNSPLYKKELYDQIKATGLEGGYTTFKTAVEELVTDEKIYQYKGERNKTFLSLTVPEEQAGLYQ